jgi:hypothetical protein
VGPLIAISNHHQHEPPQIEEAPNRYIGYFQNVYGEQWLFVRERAAATATLYGGDVAWKPVELSSRDFSPDTRRKVHGAPVVGPGDGTLMLNEPEMLWLTACWLASNIS